MPTDAELLDAMEAFFTAPVAQKATKPLSNSAVVELTIANGPTSWIARESGKTVLRRTASGPADLRFTLTRGAIEDLLALPDPTIGSIGIRIAQLLASSDPERHARVKIETGILSLLARGYLQVLPLGGPDFLKYLAERGFGSIGAVVARIKQLRGK